MPDTRILGVPAPTMMSTMSTPSPYSVDSSGLAHFGQNLTAFLIAQPVHLLPIPGLRSLHQVLDIRFTRNLPNIFQPDALSPP
jgi:hypothetical protein